MWVVKSQLAKVLQRTRSTREGTYKSSMIAFVDTEVTPFHFDMNSVCCDILPVLQGKVFARNVILVLDY